MSIVPPSASIPKGISYFTEQKKGEVNEIKALLRNISIERDVVKKREVIKKVIAYMTMGIDVSRLFSEMVLASQAPDVVIKKMVYLYLITNVQANEELAVLVINTFDKDCRSEDPTIRGLALRALLSLNLPSIIEYVVPPLQKSLVDKNAYVRKTGVIGVLKLARYSPIVVVENNFITKLESMLRDHDSQVVVNCILALSEIQREQNFVNKSLIHYLLNRIKSFNEWGQCIVLNLISNYKTAEQEEIFAIMNLLDPSLHVNNSAVVMAATKCMLRFTSHLPDIHKQVYMRLKTPLLTLMAVHSMEVVFCVLSHILIIIPRSSNVFSDEFKQFFCRYNEPTYVKSLKLEILSNIANESNCVAIANELGEYIAGTDALICKLAALSLGNLALRVGQIAPQAVHMIKDFINADINIVLSQFAISLKDILRKHPKLSNEVCSCLPKLIKSVDDPTSKASLIWILGHYGESLSNSPYLLEKYIKKYSPTESPSVHLELLCSTMTLFFKRPAEVQSMLGQLFSSIISEPSSSDVHDRALFYYRLLNSNISIARNVVLGNASSDNQGHFFKEDRIILLDSLFSEFDSLSIAYKQPQTMFISEDNIVDEKWNLDNLPSSSPARKLTVKDDFEAFIGTTPKANGNLSPSLLGSPVSNASLATSTKQNEDKLLNFEDLLIVDPVHEDKLKLKENAKIEPAQFQTIWTSTPLSSRITDVQMRQPGYSPEYASSCLVEKNISVLASKVTDSNMKFFVYGISSVSGDIILAEVNINRQTCLINGEVKCSNPQIGHAFSDLLQSCFSRNLDISSMLGGIMF